MEARRAARKAAAQAARDAQRAIDLAAINDLEIEHGDSNVATLEIPHTDGLPTMLAVKCPPPAYVKRYRDECRARKDGTPGDAIAAAEKLADAMLIYPDAETYARVLEARAGVRVQLGVLAIGLAAGRAESEGKG